MHEAYANVESWGRGYCMQYYFALQETISVTQIRDHHVTHQ